MRGRFDTLLDAWPNDVPFERVFRERLNIVTDLVNGGITWRALADALSRAGMTQRDGRPLTGRQLSAVYLRNRMKASIADAGLRPSDAPRLPVTKPARSARPMQTHGGSGGLADRLADARHLSNLRSINYDE
jgi:hypothetical protein